MEADADEAGASGAQGRRHRTAAGRRAGAASSFDAAEGELSAREASSTDEVIDRGMDHVVSQAGTATDLGERGRAGGDFRELGRYLILP